MKARWAQISIYALLITSMAFPMMMLYTISALGPYLIDEFGIKPFYLGFFNIGSFGLAAILSLFSGEILRILKLKYGFIILFSMVAFAYALMSIGRSIWWLFLSAPLIGLSQALANPLTNVFLKYSTQVTHKTFAISAKQSGVQIGALFIGSLFPTWYTLIGREMLFISIAFCIMSLSVYFYHTITYPQINVPPQAFGFRVTKPLRYLMGAQFLIGVVLSSFVIFVPLYAVYLGMERILAGSLVAFFGITGIVARLLLPVLGNRLNSEVKLFTALIIIALASVVMLLIAHQHGTGWLFPATIGIGATLVTTNAIAMGLLIKYPSFGIVSFSSGRVSAAFFSGFAVGPVLSLFITRQYEDNRLVWYLSLLLLVIVTALSLKIKSSDLNKIPMTGTS